MINISIELSESELQLFLRGINTMQLYPSEINDYISFTSKINKSLNQNINDESK